MGPIIVVVVETRFHFAAQADLEASLEGVGVIPVLVEGAPCEFLVCTLFYM